MPWVSAEVTLSALLINWVLRATKTSLIPFIDDKQLLSSIKLVCTVLASQIVRCQSYLRGLLKSHLILIVPGPIHKIGFEKNLKNYRFKEMKSADQSDVLGQNLIQCPSFLLRRWHTNTNEVLHYIHSLD